MTTAPARPSTPAVAIGALLLLVLAAGSAWGLWRLLSTALDPAATAAWLPGVILALLAAHWVIAAVRRGRDQRRQAIRLQAGRAVVYRAALTGQDAHADMALWASPEVLRLYAEYQRTRAEDPAAPFPAELLAQMRRDLGHREAEAFSADALALVVRSVVPSPAGTPATTPPRELTRTPFFRP